MKLKSDFITNSSSSSFIIVTIPDWYKTSVEEIRNASNALPVLNIPGFSNSYIKKVARNINKKINLLKDCQKIRERDSLTEQDVDEYIILEHILEDFTLSYLNLDITENNGFIQGEKTKYLDDLFLKIHNNEIVKVYEAINR